MTPHSETTNPVRRTLTLSAVAVAVATVALILVGLTVPFHLAAAVRWYCVALGSIASVALLRLTFTRFPVMWQTEPWPAALSARPLREEPSRPRLIRRAVARAAWDPVGSRSQLSPILRGIAAQRLATYRRIALDQQPGAARAVLGDRTWALLTFDASTDAPGDAASELSGLHTAVEVLEALNGFSDR